MQIAKPSKFSMNSIGLVVKSQIINQTSKLLMIIHLLLSKLSMAIDR